MANKFQRTIIQPDKQFTEVFCETLFRTKKVKLTGVGIFSIVEMAEKIIEKHPKTGKRIVIPVHTRIKFDLSKTIKRKLKAFEQKQK